MRTNVCRCYWSLGRNIPHSTLKKLPTHWLCRNPFEHSVGNFACHLNLDEESTEELVALAVQNLHFRIYSNSGDSPMDIERRLESRGLVERYRMTGMSMPPGPGLVTQRNPLFRQAESLPDIYAVSQFMVDMFFWRSGGETKAALAKAIADTVKDGQLFFFSGDPDSPQAAFSLYLTPGIAGIYNLCVRDEERGRGLGTAAVQSACFEASLRGLTPFLQCEEVLVTWYERLGFVKGTQLAAFSS